MLKFSVAKCEVVLIFQNEVFYQNSKQIQAPFLQKLIFVRWNVHLFRNCVIYEPVRSNYSACSLIKEMPACIWGVSILKYWDLKNQSNAHPTGFPLQRTLFIFKDWEPVYLMRFCPHLQNLFPIVHPLPLRQVQMDLYLVPFNNQLHLLFVAILHPVPFKQPIASFSLQQCLAYYHQDFF